MNTGEITIKEVNRANRSPKSKTAGLDKLTTEMLKHGSQTVLKELTILFNK